VDSAGHLSDEQLAQLQYGELSSRNAGGHIKSCPDCASRLRDMEAAAAAYVEYRDSIRGPASPTVPKPWATLSALIAQHENDRPARTFRWWPAAAFAVALSAVIAFVALYRPQAPSSQAAELLTQSARSESSQQRTHSNIRVRLQGREIYRPAVLTNDTWFDSDPDVKRVRQAFTEAHYSWSDPLSARSFQSWRNELRDKRDSVTVIRDRQDEKSYRVRTETSGGALRSASLTLTGADLHASNGTFEFNGEPALEMEEANIPEPPAPKSPAAIATPPAVSESAATPEDMLRVFEALDAIGADAGEPISVSEDPAHRHIVVAASGLSPERRQQIQEVLGPLRHVRLDLNARSTVAAPAQPSPAEKLSNGIPAALREQFEKQSGGAIGFQEKTDRALDASASLVARAHALQELAKNFQPDVEIQLAPSDLAALSRLRLRHASETAQLVKRIESEIKPLLPAAVQDSGAAPAANWQTGATTLWTSARDLDNSLNRLLAGRYTQPAGEKMLRELPAQMERIESAIRVQQMAK
jgi:hypothetical protein